MQTVKYKDEEYDVEVHLRRATMLDGMERSVMIANILRKQGIGADEVPEIEEGEKDEAPSVEVSLSFVEMYTYPNCVACTSEIVNNPGATIEVPDVADLNFDAFIDLPEQLVLMWLEAAIAQNPRWEISFGAAEAGEASESDSESGLTSDSLSGSNKKTKTTTPTETKKSPGS